MENKNLLKEIFKIHASKLKYLNRKNKKVAILFSGVPASGKTSVAKLIEKRFHAVRINKDNLGKFIKKEKLIKTASEDFLYDYLLHFLENYSSKNQFITLDNSIDRKYKLILKALKKNGYKTFIIRIPISKQTAIKRIKKRNPENVEEWLIKIDKWFSDFKNCKKRVKADFIVDKNSKIENLFKKIEEKIL